jgi:predicted alpha/beta-fold hydrolase
MSVEVGNEKLNFNEIRPRIKGIEVEVAFEIEVVFPFSFILKFLNKTITFAILMPILNNTNYCPIFPFRNPHINTIFPAIFRQIKRPAFLRERLTTPDDDFLDVDWLKNGNKRLVILCHGLEGSSDSQYIKGTSTIMHDHGWDVLAMNYRSCSGEINKQYRIYHSGATDDLHLVIEEVEVAYEEIILVGFSLGGNLVLKYSNDGLFQLSPKIKKTIAVSAPVDLGSSAIEILKPKNKIYERRFLKSLRKKANEKYAQFPERFPIADIEKVKTLRDFDDYFTAPIHGFKDATDYYTRCSALPFLRNVSIPTLIVNAQDDTFLSPACFPIDLAKKSELLHLSMPKYGGHVGFTMLGSAHYWVEQQIAAFCN